MLAAIFKVVSLIWNTWTLSVSWQKGITHFSTYVFIKMEREFWSITQFGKHVEHIVAMVIAQICCAECNIISLIYLYYMYINNDYNLFWLFGFDSWIRNPDLKQRISSCNGLVDSTKESVSKRIKSIKMRPSQTNLRCTKLSSERGWYV